MAADSRCIYRADFGAPGAHHGSGGIGRAQLNGTGVSQPILTIGPGKRTGRPRGVAVDPGR